MFGFGKKQSGRDQPTDTLAVLRKAAQVAITSRNPKQVAQALTSLRDSDEKLGALALVEAFAADSSTAPEKTFEILDTFAGDNDAVRYEIVSALGNTKLRKATPYLTRLLSNSEPWLRQRAIAALASIRDPAAIRDLVQAVQDEDYNIARGAVAALRNIAPSAEPQAALVLIKIEFLGSILNDNSWPFDVRAAAAQQLGVRSKPGDQQSIAALREALTSGDSEMRANVKAALEKLGETVEEQASSSGDFFDDLVGRAVDITRHDWVGLPLHVNPTTCDGSEFIPVTPGTYAVQRIERVQGQPWLVIVQGGTVYKLDGGDFRAHWPSV